MVRNKPPTTYTIQRGDNLTSIARRMGTDVETLAAANGIKNPNQIAIGQTLKNPNASVPKKGDENVFSSLMSKAARAVGAEKKEAAPSSQSPTGPPPSNEGAADRLLQAAVREAVAPGVLEAAQSYMLANTSQANYDDNIKNLLGMGNPKEQREKRNRYAINRAQDDLRRLSFRAEQKGEPALRKAKPDELPASLRDEERTYYMPNMDTAEGRELQKYIMKPTVRKSDVHEVAGGKGRQFVADNKMGALGRYTYGQTDEYEYVRDVYDYDTLDGGLGLIDGLAQSLGLSEGIGIYSRSDLTRGDRQAMKELTEPEPETPESEQVPVIRM